MVELQSMGNGNVETYSDGITKTLTIGLQNVDMGSTRSQKHGNRHSYGDMWEDADKI